MMRKYLSGILVSMVFFSLDALAQIPLSDTSYAPATADYSPSMAGIILKLILSMILIVGLIYLSMYLIKKVNARAAGGGFIGDTIKIIGRTFISPKQALYLVKIGQRFVVLGATENAISMINELTDQEAKDFENRETKAAFGSSGSKFAVMLKGIIKQ